MRSALYYPHTDIRTEELWKSALLLWDEVHTIAPVEGYKPNYKNPHFAAAYELIGVSHWPSGDEKRRAHEVIEDLATRPLPPAFSYPLSHSERPASELRAAGARLPTSQEISELYEVYPGKFHEDTWDLLQRTGLAGQQLANADYPTTQPTGLTLLSVLADTCAGTTLSRITDRSEAYASLSGLFLSAPWDYHSGEATPDQLVPMALQAVNLQDVSLSALIDMRRREQTSRGGSSITKLRHKFLDHLDTQAARLKNATAENDRKQMVKEFRDDLAADYGELREALQLRVVDTLTSKEVLGTVAVAAGAVAGVISGTMPSFHAAAMSLGGSIGIGGLISMGSKLYSSRKKILAEHPTAYLYEARSV